MIALSLALEAELSEAMLREAGFGPAMDSGRLRLIYTGVGKVNAALAVACVLAEPDCALLINYGTAGVLRPELAGKLHEVARVRQRDMDARPMAPLGITPFEEGDLAGDITLASTGPTLSTGDQFVRDKPELASDMVDMEGYALAKAAALARKKAILLKYGSDFADEDATENWRENVAKGAALFIKWLKEHHSDSLG